MARDPTIRWQVTPDITKYQVQVAYDAAFKNIVIDTQPSSDVLSYHLPFLLDPATRFYFRVRGINDCGGGIWSPTRSFTTAGRPICILPDAPGLIGPADGALVSRTPTVNWRPVGDVIAYQVQIAYDSAFRQRAIDRAIAVTQPRKFLVPRPLNRSTTFYWRVRGVAECGKGPWSEVRDFRTRE